MPRLFRAHTGAVVIGAKPAIKRDLGRAVIALKIPVMQLVKEIARLGGLAFIRDDPLKPGVREDRCRLLEIDVEHQVQRMRGHHQVDDIRGEVETVLVLTD